MKPFLYFIGGCEFVYTIQHLKSSPDKYLDFDYAYSFEHMGQTDAYKFLMEHTQDVYNKKPDVVILSQHDYMMPCISAIQLNQVHSKQRQLEQLKDLIDKCELMILTLYELNIPIVMQFFPWFRTGLLNRFKHTEDYLNEEQFMRLYATEMEKLTIRYPNFYFLNLTNTCALQGYLNTFKTKDGPWYSHIAPNTPHIAKEYADLINYLLRRTPKIKCLMVDLDNTMWKGVVRDIGIENIQVRPDGERFNWGVLAALHARGIMIGFISKNDPELETDIKKFIKEYTWGGLEFVFFSLSWTDKYVVMQEARQRLNIAMDSIAFIDDSPFEREQMKSMLPDVSVYDENIFERLLYMPEFQPENITSESKNRTKYYLQENQRTALQHSAKDKEQFLKDCDFSISVKLMEPFEISRVAELIQRTNQLNTSIKRYSQDQIVSFSKNPGCDVFVVHVSDKFGEYGLVGVCIAFKNGCAYQIDTLLFSCRVMSKGVEDYTLTSILNYAKAQNFKRVALQFNQGPKNDQMKTILENNFFTQSIGDDQSLIYSFDLTTQQIKPYQNWFNTPPCHIKALEQHSQGPVPNPDFEYKPV
jgi:FkbH-like protein